MYNKPILVRGWFQTIMFIKGYVNYKRYTLNLFNSPYLSRGRRRGSESGGADIFYGILRAQVYG